MGFCLWTILVLVFPLPSLSYRTPSPLDSNCLYRRSRCLHDTACRLRIIEFDSICGESPTECLSSSPSDCVHLLSQIKHWLGDDQCDCHPLFGASRECERFGHLLYEHPCEKLLKRESNKDEYRLIGVTRDYGRRRTTRSPSSIQINEWKKQLSGDLSTSTQLQSQECDVALHEICLRHVSCSQLWNLFRTNCNVDSDNTCVMTQREACWESFEGLLWTGLGRCHCSSNVSDCHWIRLHTNFNKCIYDISRLSGMSLSSFTPLSQSPPPTTQRVSFQNFASQSVSTPSPSTVPPTTVPPPTVPPTTVPQYHPQSTIDSSPIPTITIPRQHETRTTQQSQRIVNVERQDEQRRTGVYQRPYQVPSQPIDNRQSYPDYRTTPLPTNDPRIDNRSQIRINYGNQQTTDRYPPTPRYGTNYVNERVAPSSNQVDYRNQYQVQSRPDYRTQEEANRSTQQSHNYRQDQTRISNNQDYRNPTIDPYRNQDNRNPTSDPYGRPGSSQDYRNPPIDPYQPPIPTITVPRPYELPTTQQSQRIVNVDRQDGGNRVNPMNTSPTYPTLWYGRPTEQPSTPYPNYGTSDSQHRNSQANRYDTNTVQSRQRESEISSSTNRNEERERLEGRQDMGKITQSNERGKESGIESTRQRVDRVRNKDKHESSDDTPQQISLVINNERSRDEYQVSSPDISPSQQNPTIITSGGLLNNVNMEEERRRIKETEERMEREREEKREERRKMEDKKKKEEGDQRQKERIEKIRKEEERKIEEEKRRKENEREEKRKEKERQEKLSASRSRDNTELVSSSSTSCLSALRECESVEECKFQLAELKTRCAKNCDRKQCQGALHRFSSFVPQSLSMALSFCSCPNGDENCPEKELLYPPCIYEMNDLPKCEHIDQECRKDHKCKKVLSSMLLECPIVKGACDGGMKCTQLLLKARGTIIDTKCHCNKKDKECISIQSIMIPNHPCLAESRREFYRLETQESSISLKPVKNENSIDEEKKKISIVVAPSRPRLTTTSEPQLRVDEVESAPWLTTITVPTTTTVYTTHAPPPSEGCTIKDSKGRTLFFHVGSIIRRNLDWSGRCSSWCECVKEEVLKCHGLPCSQDINCTNQSPLFTHQYGERLYLKDRGPCMCENGEYTCAQPPALPNGDELYPGIYIMLGYSQSDIDMLEKEMPSDVYQRAGFLSNKRSTDIASRLQAVLENILPPGLKCRLSVVDLNSAGNAVLRVEWEGMVKRLNQTKISWQSGMPEKACSKYIRSLEDMFDLDESPRFQLVLSTVKQMKMIDLLDTIPDCTPFYRSITIPLITVSMILRYLF